MFSLPVHPLICRPFRLVSPVRFERLNVAPAVALTTRVSFTPPAVPATLQATPFSWLPSKVAVKPSPITTALINVKVAPVTLAVPVKRIVLIPPFPFTVSPTDTSEATPE